MSKQEAQILSELTELKDSISKVKDIFKTDIATTGQTILDKVNLDTYEFTDEEKKVKHDIEELMEFISCIVNEFYQYDEDDLNKLFITQNKTVKDTEE